MKITSKQLKRIIKEEHRKLRRETWADEMLAGDEIFDSLFRIIDQSLPLDGIHDRSDPKGAELIAAALERIAGEIRSEAGQELEEEIMAETSPTFGLRTGDMVRHKTEKDRGVGRVVAKGSARDNFVLVFWDDWSQQRHDPSVLAKEK